MRNRRNYYRLLHVGRDAPTAVIQASYRALMHRLKMHPDLGGDHEQAALINEAYATLADPVKRAAYDRRRPSVAEGVFGRRRPDGPEPRRQRDVSEPAGARGAGSPDSPDSPDGSDCTSRASRSAAPFRADEAAGPARRITRMVTPFPSSDETADCAFCGASFPVGQMESPDGACTKCGSALFPAPKHHLAEASRRAMERLPRVMPVTLRTTSSRHVVWSGETEDVSLNGMRLFSCISIPVGERVRVDCGFCSAVAVVKSTRVHDIDGRHGWQCGIGFLTLRIRRTRGGLLSALG